MKRAQLIALLVSAVFGMLGFMVISRQRGVESNTVPSITLSVWGTVDQSLFTRLSKQINFGKDLVVYREIREEEFDQILLEALARGEGPDAMLTSHEQLVRNIDKVTPLPYVSLNERSYRDIFVEGAEFYLAPTGIYGVPLAVDPLILYWNRDMLSNAGFTTPPRYWDEVPEYVQRITKKDQALTITESAIALGEYRNITNAKALLSALLFQAGTPITAGTLENAESVLPAKFDYATVPAHSVLNFYTEYSDQRKSLYTWNASLPESRSAFLAGDLALYVGFSSEAPELLKANPNLNFDAAPLPQIRDGRNSRTFGDIYAFSVLKRSPYRNQAFTNLFQFVLLSSSLVSDSLHMAPIRKDELAKKPLNDIFASVAYDSALWARAWIDPKPFDTEDVFQNMIEGVNSRRVGVAGATQLASDELDLLLKTTKK